MQCTSSAASLHCPRFCFGRGFPHKLGTILHAAARSHRLSAGTGTSWVDSGLCFSYCSASGNRMQDLLGIFPHLNAALNASSALFLLVGFYFILRRRIAQHRFCMIAACSVSALFLTCYLTHHALRTYYFGLGPTKFTGDGLIRPVYFTILTSHTILATLVTPFILATLWRGLKGKYDSHKRLARLVFPVWLYVSVTGVVVYLILYQFYPAR